MTENELEREHRRVDRLQLITGFLVVVVVGLTALLIIQIVTDEEPPTKSQVAIGKCLDADRVTLLGIEDDGTYLIAWATGGSTTNGLGPIDQIGKHAEDVFPGERAAKLRDELAASIGGDPVELDTVFNDIRVLTTGVGLRDDLFAACTVYPDGDPEGS